MNLDRVKTRIAQLLRVARNDAATDGEIENAIRAARNLMLAHHLEEANLEAADGPPKPAMGRPTAQTKFTKTALWEKQLAHFVADLIGGVCWYRESHGKATRTIINGRLKTFGSIVFFGVAEEAQLAVDTYEELATTIFTAAMAKYGSAYRGDGGFYAEGFVKGLVHQLQSANREAESSGTELALRYAEIIEAKENRAQHWLRYECGIRLQTGTRSYGAMGSGDAHEDGQSDGLNCDITGVGARRAKLPSMPKLLPGTRR